MEAEASNVKPLFEGGMKSWSWGALRLEALAILTTAMAAAGLAFLNYFFMVRFNFFETRPLLPFLSMGILSLAGLLAVIWGMSYYPKEVRVFPDRVEVRMMLGRRQVRAAKITAVRALSREEARRTFFSLDYMNLSPSVEGAVALVRGQSRTWVLSPGDAEGFIEAVRSIMGPGEKNGNPDAQEEAVNEREE
jgi:hypothetical protein